MAQALAGGFMQGPRDSAVAFRAALDALAHPGRLRRITGVVSPVSLSPAAGALLLTLADAETPVWLPGRLRGGDVEEWLRFHANTPVAEQRGGAAFALGQWEELLPLEVWPAGEPECPDRSATLVVEVDALEDGPELTLSGPGIESTARFAPSLPEGAAAALTTNAARFPLGVDLFFTSGSRVAGLPRSTRIGG